MASQFSSTSSATSIMLEIFEKKTTPLDLYHCLRNYISMYYPGSKAQNLDDDLQTLSNYRSDLQCQPDPTPSTRLDLLQTYFKSLCLIETKFPVSPNKDHINMVTFVWHDAFKQEHKASQQNIQLEKAAVLFNLGAVYSQIGLWFDLATAEGRTQAIQAFVAAAGAFAYLRDNVATKAGMETSTTVDVSVECAGMLESLMLAQAQECLFENTIGKEGTPGFCAKICRQVGLYYEEALVTLNVAPLKDHFEKGWIARVQLKAALLYAEACYWYSLELHDKGDIAEEIARLRVGSSTLAEAKKNSKGAAAQLLDAMSKLEAKINSNLDRAVKENDTVYLVSVPSPSSLPPLPAISMVKPMPINEVLDARKEKVFASLVRDTSSKADDIITTQAEILQQGIELTPVRLNEVHLPDSSLALEGKEEVEQVQISGGPVRSHEADTEVSQQGWSYSRGDFIKEAKKQLWLSGPLIAASMLQYALQVVSVMFVGHLGELPLSSASMASSFASVTGLSVLLGMGSALETLCGQAYGAQQYRMLGIYTQRGMLTLLATSIPLAIIWFYTGKILLSLGQDPQISAGAGTFNRWMIPSLFAYGLLQCLNRFLQTQNNVKPVMLSSGITALLHILLCWGLVYKSGLGSKGAALAITISNWINVFLLAVYVKFSAACTETWTGFSEEAFHGLLSFVKLAVPSAFMICLEYSSFEMVVLLSGRLPNPKLETSVLSICLNTCWIIYMISVGLGGAISTRVSNELGAGRPQGARLALYVMIIIALSEGAVVGVCTILVRHVWGKLYSNEEAVIKYVAKMMQLVALSDFLDGFQCVLSGAARGCGWQNLCALINLGAYYIVAIPSAVLLAFIFHIGGMGLWTGIICGLAVQIVALVIVIARTDWVREATKAVRRVRKFD